MSTLVKTKSIHPAIAAQETAMSEGDAAYNAFVSRTGAKRITPEMVPDSIKQIYLKQATAQLNPWFSNETAYGKKNIDQTLADEQAGYQNTIDSLNQGLQSDTQKLTNDSASSGAIRSTAYNDMRNSLASQYTNKYKSAYDRSNSNINSNLTKNEYQYGQVAQTPSLTQYGADVQNNNITSKSLGVSNRYNPFGGQGLLNVNMKNSANNMASDFLQSKIKNPNYGIN